MKSVHLLAVVASLLLLLMPAAVSAGAYSNPEEGKDTILLTGMSVPAGMMCSGQMYKSGNHLIMDICMDGKASGDMVPSGTKYTGTERLDIVLIPTDTPGTYRAHGTSHGLVDLINSLGKIHVAIQGRLHGVMVFDQYGFLQSFSFRVAGGLHVLSGEGAYSSIHGGVGHYKGTSTLYPTAVYNERDSIVAWVHIGPSSNELED